MKYVIEVNEIENFLLHEILWRLIVADQINTALLQV